MANYGLYGPPTRVPAIPDTRGSRPEDVAQAMKEWIEVREGVRGDGLDKAVTVRDLLNSGMATPYDLRNLQNPGLAGMPALEPDTDPDMPPTPENLVASGSFKYIILTWDFARGYSRLAYFEVWRGVTDVIGEAVLIAQPFGTIYADDVGGGKTYYYWVRAVSNAPATSPFSSLSGTKGETLIDPGYLLSLLQGQIGNSALNDELGGRINLIDGDVSLSGSVANRVAGAVSESYADVRQYAYSRQDVDSSYATFTQQVNSTVGGYSAAIQSNSTSINGLKLQYTLKLDNNGYVSGYGLASDPVNGVPYSTMIVRSDSFSIGSPSGPGIPPSIPFIVRTTVSVINGVVVPIGTYIQDAFIANGSISNAKIGNLQVDDAKIASMSVAKLRAGALSVSEYMESTNYAAGDTGWRVHGNGDVEFRNGLFRGTVYATAGRIGGNVLADNSVTTSKLLVGSFDNVVPDANMMDPTFWATNPGEFIAYPSTFWRSARVISIGVQGFTDRFTPMFKIAAGATYLFEYQMYLSPDFIGNISVVAHLPKQAWFSMGALELYSWLPEQSGLRINYDGNSPKGLRENQASTRVLTSAEGANPDGSNSSGQMQFRIVAQCSRGYWQVGGFRVTRMSDNVLIADGAVTANKILVNSLAAINTIVTARPNGQGAGIDQNSNGIFIYDGGNMRRVQLGNLDV